MAGDLSRPEVEGIKEDVPSSCSGPTTTLEEKRIIEFEMNRGSDNQWPMHSL